MNIGEKVAYLKGLSEGLEIELDSKYGKLITGIIDALEDIAAAIQNLEEETETLDDYTSELDEDLGELEELVYSKGQKSPHHHRHDHGEECGCGHYHNDDEEDLDDEENEDLDILEGLVQIKCPSCGDKIFIETDDLMDGTMVQCPNCKQKFVSEERDPGCGCGGCNCSEEDK